MAFTCEAEHPNRDGSSNSKQQPRLIIRKSFQSKNQKNNPVAYWKVSNQKINAMQFSADGRFLAIVSEDGSLRILDFTQEKCDALPLFTSCVADLRCPPRILDLYSSYYGGVTCVCWSPDGRFLLTGGQDDLLSLWSFDDRELVARCAGHHSWITSVAFDPWKSDDRTYRFGSVGEDCRLLLWDFSIGMLHKPRAVSLAPIRTSRSSCVMLTRPIQAFNTTEHLVSCTWRRIATTESGDYNTIRLKYTAPRHGGGRWWRR